MNRFLPAVLICLLASAGPAASQTVAGAGDNKVLTHRQQAVLIRGFIEKRFDTLLPRLMREAGIDMCDCVPRVQRRPGLSIDGPNDDVLVQATDNPRFC